MTGPMDASWIGLAVALGCGLLIGLERERRKRSGPQREAAGMRSFTLAALCGALAQTLQQPLLVAAGALAVLVLAGVAYARSRFGGRGQEADTIRNTLAVAEFLAREGRASKPGDRA